MSDVLITIKNMQEHFHAHDAVVKEDNILKIKTDIPDVTFTVVIDNVNGFIANTGKLINEEVTKTGGEVTIGTVSSAGASVKQYGIYDNSGSIPGVDPDAPPRIIRVS
jgi:hypothetical protein